MYGGVWVVYVGVGVLVVGFWGWYVDGKYQGGYVGGFCVF